MSDFSFNPLTKPLDVALYVHIPFCISKCDYCDFFSIPAGRVTDGYVEALIRELPLRAAQFGVTSWSSVYIGGGTPGLLTESQLAQLLDAVRECRPLKSGAEVTIEINPGTTGVSWIKNALQSGITRFSAGIQSMNADELQSVRRRCLPDENRALLDLLSTLVPSGGFSVDVMAGLPFQTRASCEKTLAEVISYNPAHISFYALTIEEETRLFTAVREKKLACTDEQIEDLWLHGKTMLIQSGYPQYEVSNFAKPGAECVHNLAYWNTLPYLGIGAGACGTVEAYRYTNTVQIDRWIDAVHKGNPHSCEFREMLDVTTRRFEFLMMGLRTLNGVSGAEFERRFGEPLAPLIEPLFCRWEAQNRCRRCAEPPVKPQKTKTWRYALTEEGLLFLNTFLSELL